MINLKIQSLHRHIAEMILETPLKRKPAATEIDRQQMIPVLENNEQVVYEREDLKLDATTTSSSTFSSSSSFLVPLSSPQNINSNSISSVEKGRSALHVGGDKEKKEKPMTRAQKQDESDTKAPTLPKYEKRVLCVPGYYIRSLTPLSRDAVRDYCGDALLKDIHATAKDLFKSDVSNDVKGRYLEIYVIETNQLKKSIDISNKTAFSIRISDMETVRFSGWCPEKVEIQKSCQYIPANPSYPGFDLFIWHALLKILFAIQVTYTDTPTKEHEMTFRFQENDATFGKGKVELRKKWANLFGISEEQIEVVWYVSKMVPDLNEQNVFMLDDLKTDAAYPAIRALTLA